MKTYYKGYYIDGNGAIYDSKDEVINFVNSLKEAREFIDDNFNNNDKKKVLKL